MSRYAYVAATTGRFTKWYAAHYLEHQYQPTLDAILRWLKHEEDYATPIDEVEHLCNDLRDDAKNRYILQYITHLLIYALKDERQLVDKAKSFFTAMVEKCGIDDYDVKLIDEKSGERVGTLHDLQLKKEGE